MGEWGPKHPCTHALEYKLPCSAATTGEIEAVCVDTYTGECLVLLPLTLVYFSILLPQTQTFLNHVLDVGLVSRQRRHLHVDVLERNGVDGVHPVDVLVVGDGRHDILGGVADVGPRGG